jgi:hypothetical protein
MPRWPFQLAILFAVLLAIFWVSLSRKGENVLAYCEPECPETVEHRAPETRPLPEKPNPIGDLTPRRLLALLIAGLIGFALSRITGNSPPSASDVDAAIAGEAADRQAEATRHGLAASAGPLLAQLELQAKNAVKKLLPPPQIGEIIAMVLVAALILALFLLPPNLL